MNPLEAIGIDLRGRTSGHVDTVCPACAGQRRKKRVHSLSVEIDTGLYNCHHCGWSGRVRTQAGAYGTPDKIEKAYTRPSYRIGDGRLSDAALAWLRGRGIADAAIARANLASRRVWMPQADAERECIAFPYTLGGEVVNVKYRDGNKNFRMEKNAERIMYGIDDIDPAVPLVWVEGELDKLACATVGRWSCLSIPNGAPPPTAKNLASHYEPIDHAMPYLAAVRSHIIAVDDDDPGRGLRDELVRRLGAENCRIAIWPEGCKDANDVLMRHGAAHLARCLDAAPDVPIAGSFTPDDLADDLADFYERGASPGIEAGTPGIAAVYRPMPGLWTVVNGIPGNGKSSWLDWYAYRLMLTEGWRFAICSPETRPIHRHLSKLIRIHVGKPFHQGTHERMTRAEMEDAREWFAERVRFIAPEEEEKGGYSLDNILDLCRSEIRRFGVKGVIIDPWNELEHSRPPGLREDEYIAQSLIQLRQFARRHAVHVWLVAHPTKLAPQKDGSNPVPRLYDLAGGAMWANKADYGIAIHRADPMQIGPAEMYVQKVKFQPEGGTIARIDLEYDSITGRYRDAPKATKKAKEVTDL